MRASEIVDLIRDSSRRWSDRISRWRARLFNLTADEEASESSSLVSWPTSASLFSSSSCRFVSVLSSSSEGFWGMFGAAANCEYVWKSVSVWQTVLALYLRRCRDYLPAARGRALVGALASILRLGGCAHVVEVLQRKSNPSASNCRNRHATAVLVFWHHTQPRPLIDRCSMSGR